MTRPLASTVDGQPIPISSAPHSTGKRPLRVNVDTDRRACAEACGSCAILLLWLEPVGRRTGTTTLVFAPEIS
ncbi:MAG: hypothetical protein M3256_25190, partial [Actinomycetota bacterium]|nr:hypothetical protein [Actinomycetota bacterium]